MISEFLISFKARPAKGAPSAVGTDVSTIHLFSFVREPDEVAREADTGRMICRPV
jgi:hypothetical protein